MVSIGVVREWHFDDWWGVIDSDDTPDGAYVRSQALRVEAVVDPDHAPMMGLRPGTEVEFDWTAADNPVEGMRYRVDRAWPRGTAAPPRESAFQAGLWNSVGGPGPDGLIVMREDLGSNNSDVPAVDPPVLPTAVGTVRFWHDEQGWGVLDAGSTPGGVWAHFSAIVGTGFARLDAGQSVQFEYEQGLQDGYDFRAVSVKGL
ncbi:MAG: cold shock domain-containing protein [Rhodococcus sp. (in: high G+C Gram-positive bacteria)]